MTVSNVFAACTLPWAIWPWGIKVTHSDSDATPECSMTFGAMIVRPTRPYEQLWVRLEFELAAFVSARPHRDDEQLADVSGYDIVPRRQEPSQEHNDQREIEWLRTGVCPDPNVYFSTDTVWLTAERQSWADRQRGTAQPADAVHFLLDGRDGYVEILAAGFTWEAWHHGHPKLSDVEGDPIRTGRRVDGDTPAV